MRTTRSLAAAAAAAAMIAVSAPATAAGHDDDHRDDHRDPLGLNATAQAAGLTPADGGQMGWRSSSSANPQAAAADPTLSATVAGIDVSNYQGSVDWASSYSQGKRFAYVKASEGTYYTSPSFSSQYTGSYDAGFIRGSYHFANPSDSSGAAQATYFVEHGGGWSQDGKTLPGALDIEYNPYDGGTCYGLSQAAMVSWISDFVSTYKSLTGRDAVIYSTTDWWTTCTGNSSAFAASNPLWIARYASSAGTLPAGWGYYTIWQNSSSPIDQDVFNGDESRLEALANG
ncbi:lysozyme [Nocardioides mangrovicus]|uniref:lysozyme n=1 Tax=Nocardioides mangrovicus TaxID=2478913 RepID=A0A3L8P3J7_9ACTN|nr:lysozyme [Nocardioides mangrovicus]RLV49671.1 lysozyme [Nocardioides mangrovicus]